jgi:outer membrane protein
MKVTLKQAVLSLGFVLALALPASAQQKIGTIDLRQVFDNYWKTKQADSALKDKAGDLDGERKKMIDQYNKMKGDYKTALEKANEQAVSAEEREKRKKAAEAKLTELNDQETQINQFDRQARTTLDEQQRRMRDNILSEIKGVIETKARTGGYSLVLDTAGETANRTPEVLFTTGENDITKAVLSQLNETAPANRAVEKDKEKK